MDAKQIWDEFSATWKQVFFKPEDFFREWDQTEGWDRAIKFIVICGVVAGLIFTVFTFGMGIGKVVFYPVFFLVVTVIGGVLLFVCAKLLGGAGEIEPTIKMVGYTQAVNVLSFGIPFIGKLAILYQLWLLIVGCRFVHKMDTGKAALAVFIPAIVLGSILLILGIIGLSIVGILVDFH